MDPPARGPDRRVRFPGPTDGQMDHLPESRRYDYGRVLAAIHRSPAAALPHLKQKSARCGPVAS
ncbi:hypothetical protein [Paenibacillus odorifer]|uniref:hypothetical protein n=1 Tax=Paenibacillus odorifer TaxID=189426 RepID=UPI0021165011|nr:hypothetical protein [Paenibacillus odorifer]